MDILLIIVNGNSIIFIPIIVNIIIIFIIRVRIILFIGINLFDKNLFFIIFGIIINNIIVIKTIINPLILFSMDRKIE